jgi:hypothetical protein
MYTMHSQRPISHARNVWSCEPSFLQKRAGRRGAEMAAPKEKQGAGGESGGERRDVNLKHLCYETVRLGLRLRTHRLVVEYADIHYLRPFSELSALPAASSSVLTTTY